MTTQQRSELLLFLRALENLLDTGEVGIQEFANSVYAVAGHGEDQEMVEGGNNGGMESDNGTNCSDGGCSDESYEGETADFEAGSGFSQQQGSQYSFFGARHPPPPPR